MNETAFFDTMRRGLLGPTLSQDEVDGCKAIFHATRGWPVSWVAYALATAYHETAGTMQPIKEIGSQSYFTRKYDPKGERPAVAKELGNTQAGDGPRYAGRGYVQLTGRRNYAHAGAQIGFDLVGNPDLAMRPDVAAAVMRRGMEAGWFTGRGLSDFLPRTGQAQHLHYRNARRIINGSDKANTIANYALQFERALVNAGVR